MDKMYDVSMNELMYESMNEYNMSSINYIFLTYSKKLYKHCTHYIETETLLYIDPIIIIKLKIITKPKFKVDFTVHRISTKTMKSRNTFSVV